MFTILKLVYVADLSNNLGSTIDVSRVIVEKLRLTSYFDSPILSSNVRNFVNVT